MTCIVGLVAQDGIIMGADSAGVAGYDVSIRADEKVFFRGEMLFGFTTSFRMGQLIRYKLNIPAHPSGMNVHEYLSTHFIDALRHCLKEGGFAEKENDVESAGQFLVGYRGRLFHIEADYQVGERVDPFDAVGCGAPIALGAMHALFARALAPDKVIGSALSAAAHLNAGVRPPFSLLFLSVKLHAEPLQAFIDLRDG